MKGIQGIYTIVLAVAALIFVVIMVSMAMGFLDKGLANSEGCSRVGVILADSFEGALGSCQ